MVDPSAYGLRRNKLLQGLPEDVLRALAQQCRWRRIPAKQRVISRQARDQDVYLVVSGRVRVTLFSSDGRQVTFRDIVSNDWFGDFAAIDGKSRSADVVALEDAVLATMSPALFRTLLNDHPEVCNRVLLRLVQAARELTERVFELSTLGVQNRVHAEVLRLAREAGIKANTARIDPMPGHSEIASQVSTYREQVTREINRMAEQDLVRKDGRHALVVPDVARLEKIVADVRHTH